MKEGRKEERKKEGRKKGGNVLFNDAPNTFFLWLYGVNHMVNDYSDSERRNPPSPYGLLFPISKDSFICTSPYRQDSWLERELAEWVHYQGSF